MCASVNRCFHKSFEQNTLTRHIFSCFLCTHHSIAHDIGSRSVAHVIPSHPCLMRIVCLLDTTLHSSPSLSSSTSFFWSSTSSSSSMWVGSERSTLYTLANEEPDTLVDNAPLTGYEQKGLRRLIILRDHWNFHPGVLQRQQVLKSAWSWIRWLHHRHGALFTTVHSRARRTSGPQRSFSLSWRKFVSPCLSVM